MTKSEAAKKLGVTLSSLASELVSFDRVHSGYDSYIVPSEKGQGAIVFCQCDPFEILLHADPFAKEQ